MALISKLFGGEITPARAWFGPVLVIGIADPQDMQTVLSSPHCLQKGYMYKFIHNQSGLFTADGMSATTLAITREHINSKEEKNIINSLICSRNMEAASTRPESDILAESRPTVCAGFQCKSPHHGETDCRRTTSSKSDSGSG